MNRKKLIEGLQAKKTVVEAGQDVVVGLFKPEDALGVSLAYREIYGDSFPIEHVYDPEEVAKRNETEDQYTVVARTPKGEIIGLAGLFRHAPNKDVFEAGQLMVFKSYRSGEVAQEIVSLLLVDLPRRLGLEVVFVEAVCNHPASQQLAYTKGLMPTGIGLECMPAEAYATEGDVKRNVSLLLMFRVNKDQNHKVYLPPSYTKTMWGLYEKLGLSRSEGVGTNLSGKTAVEKFLLPDAKFARLTVEKAGTDFLGVIVDIEKNVGGAGLIQTYVNIGDPSAPQGVNLLRERGYIFGGVLPLWFGSDGIIMQKLPREPEWDGIRLHYKESKKLLEYLRADYNTVNL